MQTRRLAPFSTTLGVGQWIGVCAGICEAQAPSGAKSFDPSLNLSYMQLFVLNEGWGR